MVIISKKELDRLRRQYPIGTRIELLQMDDPQAPPAGTTGTDQLRLLRKNYPDLWALLLKWDADSPTTFKPDGHTVHDYDRSFAAEDAGKIPTDRRFRWAMLDAPEQLSLFERI